MFLGLYNSTCRIKNRIAFPAKLKQQTGDNLVLTNWFEKTVLVLPKASWEELFGRLFQSNAYLLSEVRELDRFIFGGSYEVELDGEGRFVLPKYLKDYGEIKKEIVFVGGAYYILLQDKDRFESMRELVGIQVKEKAIKVFEGIKELK